MYSYQEETDKKVQCAIDMRLRINKIPSGFFVISHKWKLRRLIYNCSIEWWNSLHYAAWTCTTQIQHFINMRRHAGLAVRASPTPAPLPGSLNLLENTFESCSDGNDGIDANVHHNITGCSAAPRNFPELVLHFKTYFIRKIEGKKIKIIADSWE